MGFVVLSILGETLTKDGFHRASIEQKYWDYVACATKELPKVQRILTSYTPVTAQTMT